MSKNNSGILSWHSSDELKRRPVKDAKPKKPKVKERPEPPVLSESLSQVFKLQPHASQKSILDGLFSGPILLRTLLSSASKKPKSSEDASLFLLQHHKELQPFLYQASDRGQSIELLKGLILEWGVFIPEMIELEFTSDCSITSDHKIFFPIPRIGTLAAKDSAYLTKCHLEMVYAPSFTLGYSDSGYFAHIDFVQKKRGALMQRQKSAEKPSQSNSRSKMRVDHFLMIFESKLQSILMDEMRASKSFVSTNYDSIRGWEMPGGLPSLGKRR